MPYSPYRFVGPQALSNLPINLVTFTQPVIIKQIMITNVTNGNLNFTMYLIPSGQQVGSLSNELYSNYVVPGNTTATFNLSLVCLTNESLYAVGSIANGLNVTISGVTQS